MQKKEHERDGKGNRLPKQNIETPLDAERKAKAQLEPKLAWDFKKSKKVLTYCMYVGKQKGQEKVGPLLSEGGKLVTNNREKCEDFPSCLLCLDLHK